MTPHSWTRRQVLNTAAGTGVTLGAAGALSSPGVAQAHDGGHGGGHGHGGRLEIIAIEEAVILPGLITEGTALDGVIPFKPEVTAEWFRRLPDVAEYRIADMDENGVTMQVLSLTPPGIQMQPDAAIAVTDARTANDALAGIVAERPTRFGGLAALPLQDPPAAVREARRAIDELGLAGFLVNGHTLGHYLDEPQFREVWAVLEELQSPLYLHPTPAPAGEWAIPEGRPELVGPLYTWAAETAGHALRVILGGVFDDFPGARLILGHMGEFLPFHASRLDVQIQNINTQVALRRKPSEYLADNILITTSGVMDDTMLRAAIDVVGIDNVLFAIDYPFERSEQAVEFLRSADVPHGHRRKIASGNARRHLRL
ncbi:amidohydrolase family protein [Streptomyces sp. 3MP-14]|uniref:Amidohydrolase family protein n=1 Tax=Streptomyces mimosae TaxID=2586635 RepID=A0A5N5ZSG5_9ACTN|nr:MULTISPECIES: amidohydrolase family protein [Streptomyces]KAB8159447.1 amidohydrolase family protein [Streptomyces mimosae]KAB8172665.1 amidohydrolase family protein [Streptomyces sp. 3MP-14]